MAFFESESFEDAIRNAISIGGDSDTLAAITGGIAEAYYGIPESIRKHAFGSTVVVDSLSTASVLMDFKAGGTGIAVGKVSENDDCFEVSDHWDVRVYGMLLADYIRAQAGGGGGIAFGTCETGAATQAKVATTNDGSFERKKGAAIAVKFTYENTYNMPTLNIDGTGATYIVQYGNYVPAYARQMVDHPSICIT